MSLIIRVKNISKQYRLGQVGTGTLSHDLNRWWHRFRGRDDPYLRIGEENDRTKKGESDYSWALRDVNFDIAKGDAVGIIGRNGAGKSTLLKILSRTTAPTTGQIKIKGRVASLLEVGTGFHPELTGRENIFLNGAILGMSKQEITSKFDEIVDFAGVERYIDTPVKRYSSGMYVRLAFGVAAHLEPEILIVDEVLAVGDAEFQRKALGKMENVSKNQGRTVLFVSHNMGAIQTLCNNLILMEKGRIQYHGNVKTGLDMYLNERILKSQYVSEQTNLKTGFKEIKLSGKNGINKGAFGFEEQIVIGMIAVADSQFHKAKIGFYISDNLERKIFTSEIDINRYINEHNEVSVCVSIPPALLMPGKYNISFAIHLPNVAIAELHTNLIFFEIEDTGSDNYMYANVDNGCVAVRCEWEKMIK